MDVTAGDKGGHLTSVESRLLVALTLAALAARLAWLWLEPRCQPSGDEPTWIAIASLPTFRLSTCEVEYITTKKANNKVMKSA